MSYVKKVYEMVEKRNQGEPEFLQAVKEVLDSLEPVVKKHKKARKSGETSRILEEESYIPLCRVMPVCPSCKKSCRIQVKFLEEGKKARVCHRCKEAF